MESCYVDQSAKGLRYYFAHGIEDVTELTVLASIDCSWKEHTLTMGILGASHFLHVRGPHGRDFTEILACAELSIHNPIASYAPCSDAFITKIQHSIHRYLYTFQSQLWEWSEGEMHLHALQVAVTEACNRDHTLGLTHQFPSLDNVPNQKPPLTLIWARAGEDFIMRTAHCYPNEDRFVLTTTTLSRG